MDSYFSWLEMIRVELKGLKMRFSYLIVCEIKASTTYKNLDIDELQQQRGGQTCFSQYKRAKSHEKVVWAKLLSKLIF